MSRNIVFITGAPFVDTCEDIMYESSSYKRRGVTYIFILDERDEKGCFRIFIPSKKFSGKLRRKLDALGWSEGEVQPAFHGSFEASVGFDSEIADSMRALYPDARISWMSHLEF